MKRFFFKHILRAKFICEGKFFWRWGSAWDFAESQNRKTIIWSINYKKLHATQDFFWNTRLHPDANNFNTNI